MKNIKKAIALFAMLFNVFSVCNGTNKKPMKVEAEEEPYSYALLTNIENPKNIAICYGQLTGDDENTIDDSGGAVFNQTYSDKNIVNCVITNNKSTFLSFDAAHNSNTVEGYPQDAAYTREELLELFKETIKNSTEEDKEESNEEGNEENNEEDSFDVDDLLEYFVTHLALLPCDVTNDPRMTNNSQQSFVLGAYLYKNIDNPSKHDLILYADIDAIIIEPNMFTGFKDLQSINFEGCYTYGMPLSGMFQGCENLVNVNLDGLNCHEVIAKFGEEYYHFNNMTTDFSNMFDGCSKLEEVVFNNMPYVYENNSKYTNANYHQMFNNCVKLQRVRLDAKYVKSASPNKDILNDYFQNFFAEYDLPFGEVLYNWDGKATTGDFDKRYSEMFKNCDDLTVVAFSNYFNIIASFFESFNQLQSTVSIGLFVNSGIEDLNYSLGGNVFMKNTFSEETLNSFSDFYGQALSIDTCGGKSEEVNQLVSFYEEIISNPDKKNEAFILNSLTYMAGIHETINEQGKTEWIYDDGNVNESVYFVKITDKLNYMLTLKQNGNSTSQNDIITTFISNNYNAFIIIGLVSLASVIAYYIIEKKKVVNN